MRARDRRRWTWLAVLAAVVALVFFVQLVLVEGGSRSHGVRTTRTAP